MYHRIATPATDVWEIAVSPQHFETHLQVLQQTTRVVPLSQLVDELAKGTLERKTVALSFDDGYADNFETALPLLEQYSTPATFFLTSTPYRAYWWDELELLLLNQPQLPPRLPLAIGGHLVDFDLQQDAVLTTAMQQQHASWKPLEQEPPTRRCRLYLELWENIRPQKPDQQQECLQKLRNWAGVPALEAGPIMTPEQVAALRRHPLIEVGAHTVHHVALGYHEAEFQQQEIANNKHLLEQSMDTGMDLLAYPYGHHNQDSMKIAAGLGFAAAFTTDPKYLTKRSNRYQLGRFHVPDCDGSLFKKQLATWFQHH